MQNNLLTAGRFARLARTTKRTITWYDQKDILKPVKINSEGYRFYQPSQIIDFQVILLLRRLEFSLPEIKEFLKTDNSLKHLFELKRVTVLKEIKTLQKALSDIDLYYKNLGKNGTFVSPKVKSVKPFMIFYLDKTGPYADIKKYSLELKSMFKTVPKNAVYLTIFYEGDYRPKKAKMTIGVIADKYMTLNKKGKEIVKSMQVPGYVSLSHIHTGPGSLLSLLWQELAKYARENKYRLDSSLPFADLEFYHQTSLNEFDDEEGMIFELNLPVLTGGQKKARTRRVRR